MSYDNWKTRDDTPDLGHAKQPSLYRRECIVTSYVHPPIPVRSNDWCAYYDNLGADCSPYGWGATEQEAIDELLAWVEDNEAAEQDEEDDQ